MTFRNFIGIDISKGTFDFALIKDGDLSNPISGETTNNLAGIVKLEEFLKKQGLIMDETLFCMEHTGIYCRLLSQYLVENNYHVWLESLSRSSALWVFNEGRTTVSMQSG